MSRTHHHARRVWWCVLAALAQPTHPHLNLGGLRVSLSCLGLHLSAIKSSTVSAVIAWPEWKGFRRLEIKRKQTAALWLHFPATPLVSSQPWTPVSASLHATSRYNHWAAPTASWLSVGLRLGYQGRCASGLPRPLAWGPHVYGVDRSAWRWH